MDEHVKRIAKLIAKQFPTMGGEQEADGNLIAAAFKGQPLTFALGVGVEDVVRMVITELTRHSN